MIMAYQRLCYLILAISLTGLSSNGYAAKYSPGASDKEIKIGNTGPYSGPFASYSRVLKTIHAYFKMVNEQGGINGRQILFKSYDDAYDPAKTLAQVEKLVEKDNVLFTLFTIGTPSNLAVRQYMNEKKVPQLFVGSGAYLFNQPKDFPWTNPGVADYMAEAKLYAKYLLENRPNAKIGILYQNDDYGKSYLGAFLEELGDKAKQMVVAKEAYSVKDPDIKGQMSALQKSGADTFINISTAKFAIQSVQLMSEMKWNPLHIMTLTVASRENVFSKVGFDKVQGVLTAQITKDPANLEWSKDEDMLAYKAFMKKYEPELDPNDVFIVTGYLAAAMTVELLKECGDDLTRENLIKVRNKFNYRAPLLLPGVKIELSADDLRLVKYMDIVKFEGQSWQPVADKVKLRD